MLAADPHDRSGHEAAARLDVANGRFEAILSLAVVIIDRPHLAQVLPVDVALRLVFEQAGERSIKQRLVG